MEKVRHWASLEQASLIPPAASGLIGILNLAILSLILLIYQMFSFVYTHVYVHIFNAGQTINARFRAGKHRKDVRVRWV